jgi:predicted Fe-Mo cluster-binding NifX family protein
MKIKYPYININCSDITNHPGSTSSSSFIEKDSNDFINVKFTSNGNNIDSYPTIEKMISQMMTRRDLSEKYIRLKILETESRLQKALSEFIEDTLHDNIYRIISKYAPAIEGLKEHIK